MFLFNIATREANIRFERDVVTNKVTVDKIAFIKAIRNTTHCGLKDAKDFCDMMINQLNKLQVTPETIRRDIQNEILNIENQGDLIDILRFVRTVKQYDPTQMGTFDHEGNYHPNPL